MHSDECIIVDDQDTITGHASKYDSHSHPLYGYSPSEVDTDADIRSGSVPGVKHGAQRKLGHELGIAPEQVPPSAMHYLTRLHYCAGDADGQGRPTGWGEHEMDYIIFLRANVQLNVNPEEVMATRYVTPSELAEMMDPGSGLRWSPWFRIIAREFLPRWWQNLDKACRGDPSMQDLANIHHLS
ncbi:hypothetical protein QBZ16_001058 [Prototheca wickerhamii]|uniref:isopentenyl-diphosphate Delta-isomerase n=1 Tax=Prototheca wickerhamii TaxID=3111 RepID=A0AAD9MLZ5_PROWI|nr:hypothetical protein QBZ16_001058 [Prototheca wickerhamii]